MILKIKKTNPRAKLPLRATKGSAGADLYSCIDEDVVIRPGESVVISTGISVQTPRWHVTHVYARSGLAMKHGITLTNGVGVIDSDYTGEIRVGLINLSKEEYTVKDGERIAQIVVTPIVVPKIKEVDELEKTQRGKGGFGSTGKK